MPNDPLGSQFNIGVEKKTMDTSSGSSVMPENQHCLEQGGYHQTRATGTLVVEGVVLVDDQRTSDVSLYSAMMRIRLLEEELLRLSSQGLLFGTTHTSIGQEAVAVGTLLHLQPQDWVFSNHRCHAHFLAQGGKPKELIAEVMGRVSGVCPGRGGSQHLHQGRFISTGVQGGLLPAALGKALAIKIRGEKAVVVAFLGDGTLGEGILYETLNMAALWQAPVLFVLENNRIAQTTPVELAVAGSMRMRAEAFGIRTSELEVQEIWEVVSEIEKVFHFVRGAQSPFFQVFHTYRLGPHSKGDDTRSAEELRPWREHDPLRKLRERIPQKTREAIDQTLTLEIQRCVEECINAPWPESDTNSLQALAPTITPERRPIAYGSEQGPRVVESLNKALHELMDADPTIHAIGQDILDPYGGAFKVTTGLSTRHPDRVWTTPISEAAIVGVASGMALAGLKPVVELMFGDFIALASDQIVNHLSKFYFLSCGHARVNVVIRTPMGGGRGYGATHSQNLEKMFLGIPGLKVVAISVVLEPGILLRNAVEYDPNPILFVENKLLYPERVRRVHDGRIDDFLFSATTGLYPTVTLNIAGCDERDVTVVSYGRTALMAMDAARELFLDEEIVAEIVVVSQLSPLPLEGLWESATKSGKVLIVEEGPLEAGWGAEVLARLAEAGLSGQCSRVGALPCPIPASKPLENLVLPTVQSIRLGIKSLLKR